MSNLTSSKLWWPLAANQNKEDLSPDYRDSLPFDDTTTMAPTTTIMNVSSTTTDFIQTSSPLNSTFIYASRSSSLGGEVRVEDVSGSSDGATSTTAASTLSYEDNLLWRELFIHQDTSNLYYWNDFPNVNNDNLTTMTADSNYSVLWGADNFTFLGVGDNFTNNNTTIIETETTLEVITMIATAVILGLVILATVIGNVFVIAAILLERNLQNVANYLILSLAVADLLVACLVMPLSAVYEVSKQWTLGPELCDMWTSSDVLCCTASILHLVAIALDRYWAVTNIDYIHQRTAKRIGMMILVVWSLAFVVCIAPMLGWKDDEWDHRVNKELTCMVSQDLGYQIFATASSFYLPLLVILILYWRIFQTARKRIRRRQATQGGTGGAGAPKNPAAGGVIAAASGSGGIAAAVVTIIGRPLPTISETTTAFTTVSSANTSPEKTSFANGLEPDPPTTDMVSYQPQQASHHHYPVKRKSKDAMDSKRERKAAKTLAIITGAFVMCWLPFFIMAILLPVFRTWTFNEYLMSFFLWLGYFNSTLNPIIYTIFSPEFRQAFKRILCGRRATARRRNRHFGGIRHFQ